MTKVAGLFCFLGGAVSRESVSRAGAPRERVTSPPKLDRYFERQVQNGSASGRLILKDYIPTSTIGVLVSRS